MRGTHDAGLERRRAWRLPVVGLPVVGTLLLVLLNGCQHPVEPQPRVRVVPQVAVVAPRRVQWSPRDANRLLVMDASGRVEIWDAANGSVPYLFASIPAGAVDACFTPDGASVLTAGYDGRVRWWTVEGRAVARSQAAHPAAARAVAASADQVVSAGEDGTLRVWHTDGTAVGGPLTGHKGPVVSVAIGANGDIISVGSDGTLRRWKPAGTSSAPTFESAIMYRQANPMNPRAFMSALKYDVHWGWDHSVVFSPRGDVLAATLFDSALHLWNADGSLRSEVHDAHGKRTARGLAFSPAGDVLATAGFDGRMRLWNLDGSPLGNPIEAHQDLVYSVSFSADGARLATTGADDRVRLWSLDGTRLGELPYGRRDPVVTVAVSSREPVVAVAHGDGIVRVSNLAATPLRLPIATAGGKVTALACSPAGDIVVTGSADGAVRTWGVDGTARAQLLGPHPPAIGALVFDPAADRVVSGSDAVRLLRLNVVPIGGVVWQGPPSDDTIESLAFSPRGDLIAAGGIFGHLQLWSLTGDPLTERLKLAKEDVRALAFAPDGFSFASAGGSENLIRLWNLDGTQREPPLDGHRGAISALASSPEMELLASGSTDGELRLWHFPTGDSTAIGVGVPVDQIGFERRLLWVRAGNEWLFFYDSDRRLVATGWLTSGGLLVYTPDGWFAGPTAATAVVRVFDESGASLSAADAARRVSPERVEAALAQAAGAS